MESIKERAKQIIDALPEQATFDDIMYESYVKQKIEAGVRAVDESRTTPHDEVRAVLDRR